MQILKVKNITEFESSEVPADSLLVFPERQTDGSYLWRCKDSENNTGTIGTGVETVNGKTGPNVVLEHSDVGAVAEDLNAEYGRPDSLLSQMMFFVRNGAVNLYATLADLKNFLSGFFADINHSHPVGEISDFEDAVESKLDKELLVPTTAVYIDGNRTDEYIEDGSIAYPYKTIAAATAAHQEPASYFIAKSIYMESAEINLYADSVVYGAYSTISGEAITIGEGCYVHNLVFYNTVNVAVNGNSPMFHYCRFMGAPLNLNGSTDFDGCYISSAATFNVTMAASGSLRAFNSSIHTVISAACRMYFNDCMFSVSSTGYAVTSTAGLLSMVACLVYNTSTGGGISCVNGANGVSTYNFLVSIATNKDIACGTAVSIIGGDVQYASLTGVAIVFPARIQTALAGKAASNHNHDAVYAAIGHSHSEYALSNHNHSGVYAAVGHTHNEYALTGHNHNGVYSAVGHGHTIADVAELQTALDGKQEVASTRYEKGNISGAVSIDYGNGNYQVCTTVGDVTGITIANLPANSGMVLLIDNADGRSVTFGTVELISSTETGQYVCAFFNDNGTTYLVGRSQRYS